MKKRPGLDILLFTGILLIIIAITGIVMLSNRYSAELRKINEQVANSNQVIQLTDELLVDAVNIETGSRGFALTGNEIFLEPLKKSDTAVVRKLELLSRLLRGDVVLNRLLNKIRINLDLKIKQSQKQVQVRREKGLNEAAALVATGEGKLYLDEIRYAVADLQRKSAESLQLYRDTGEKTFISQNRVQSYLLILVFVFIVGMLGYVWNELVRRKRIQAELTRFNETLNREVKKQVTELNATFERITDAFVALDRGWRYTYMNKKAGEIFNRDPAGMIGKHIWTEFPEGIDQPFHKAYEQAMREQQYVYLEEYYPPYDKWFENHIYPSADGISVFFREITQQKKAQQKLQRINRLYNFISDVNHLIVRTNNEAELYREVCRIAVETGGFHLAWIGMINADTERVEPVSFSGQEKGYLLEMKQVSIRNESAGKGPTGTAIREGHTVVCNDIEKDPRMEPWRAAALERGYRSSVSLPLRKLGKIVGSFSLYSSQTDYFNNEELFLLEKVTDDLGFSLDKLEHEQKRLEAETALQKAEAFTSSLINASPDIIYIYDILRQENVYINDGMVKNLGFTDPQIKGMGNQVIPILMHPDDFTAYLKNTFPRYAGMEDAELLLHEYRMKDIAGNWHWFYCKESIFQRTADGRPEQIFGIATDITERKNAEEQIVREKELSDTIIDSLPGVFYLYNQQGKFLRWNGNFEKVTGYGAEEMSALHPLDFFTGPDKSLLEEKIRNVFEKGEDQVEAGFKPRSGQVIPYYFTGRTIFYQGETCLMGVGIDISDRVKAQEEIRLASEQLRRLTAHLQVIREEERKRIGREIHDELGQQLTAIKMDVAWIDKKTPPEAAQLKVKLKNMIALLDSSHLSVRKILNELRMGILDHQALEDALIWQARQFSDNTGIPLEFSCPEPVTGLSETVASCLFRVFQESLTNITRYAKARQVKASLLVKMDKIFLEVRDDGTGFDPVLLNKTGSFGILGMRERVTALKGNFAVETAPGKGTCVRVSLPLTDENLAE